MPKKIFIKFTLLLCQSFFILAQENPAKQVYEKMLEPSSKITVENPSQKIVGLEFIVSYPNLILLQSRIYIDNDIDLYLFVSPSIIFKNSRQIIEKKIAQKNILNSAEFSLHHEDNFIPINLKIGPSIGLGVHYRTKYDFSMDYGIVYQRLGFSGNGRVKLLADYESSSLAEKDFDLKSDIVAQIQASMDTLAIRVGGFWDYDFWDSYFASISGGVWVPVFRKITTKPKLSLSSELLSSPLGENLQASAYELLNTEEHAMANEMAKDISGWNYNFPIYIGISIGCYF